jgi:hypothetical protein
MVRKIIGFGGQKDSTPILEVDAPKVFTTDEELLDEVVPRYVKNKTKVNELTKLCDDDNKLIKKVLLNSDKNGHSTKKGSVKISSYEKVSFDENALINVITDLKIKGIIKTKQYVDMQALETAIVDKKIDAKELAKCQNVKTIVNLNIE